MYLYERSSNVLLVPVLAGILTVYLT